MQKRKYLSIIFIVILMSIARLSIAQKIPNITPDTIIYKTIDTTRLEMWRYLPPNFSAKKTYPAVVFFHGGGWNSGSPKAFNRQARYLASRGMISFSVEYRVRNVDGTTPFEAVADAKSAIRFVRTHAKALNIDPDQLVAGGGSAGGHIAAATGVIDGLESDGEDLAVSSRPTALLLYNPVIDNGKEGYGYRRMNSRYLEISPIDNIRKGAPPTVFFVGTEDKLIPVSTAKAYETKMLKVGSRCDLHLYEGEQHKFFNKKEYLIKTLYETDLFLISLGYLDGEPTIGQ